MGEELSWKDAVVDRLTAALAEQGIDQAQVDSMILLLSWERVRLHGDFDSLTLLYNAL